MIWVLLFNDNINFFVYGSVFYYGYWMRDYKRIEEYFGGWEDFRWFVKEVKKWGICIIVDYVFNYLNLVNYGEYGVFYDNGIFLMDYFKDMKNVEVNLIIGICENVYYYNGNIYIWSGILFKYVNFYGFVDFNQFNLWVDLYFIEGVMFFVDLGVCGFRIDVVKYMEFGWFEIFYFCFYFKGLFFIYGEYFIFFFQKGDDFYEFYCYLNVFLVFSILIREDIVRIFVFFGGFDKFFEEFGDYYFYFVYLIKVVNFFDSYDFVCFLNVGDRKDEIQCFYMVFVLILILLGIFVIYYGDESYFVSKDGKGDFYNRLMMVFDNIIEVFRIICIFGGLRKISDVFVFGDFMIVIVFYEIWVFERIFGNYSFFVVMNKGFVVNLIFFVDWFDGNYCDVFYGGEMVVLGGKVFVYFLWDSVYVFYIEGEQKKLFIGLIIFYVVWFGQEIVIGGVGFGKGGKVIIGGREVKVFFWEDGKIVVEVFRLEILVVWVNVMVVLDGGRSFLRFFCYYLGNDVFVFIVFNVSFVGEVFGMLWFSGDFLEFGELRLFLKLLMGYYFMVVLLLEGVLFLVRFYEGKVWGVLRLLNLIFYGVGNRIVIFIEKLFGVLEG